MRSHRLLVLGALVVGGCSASPTEPTAGDSDHQSVAVSAPLTAGRGFTSADLVARGWSCFQPPVLPIRLVCSHPNQGFPTPGNPPPDDRPASFTFKVFDEAGHFLGTQINLRTDLYNGQLCESTGAPYVFRDVIGYYECIHTAGSDN